MLAFEQRTLKLATKAAKNLNFPLVSYLGEVNSISCQVLILAVGDSKDQ